MDPQWNCKCVTRRLNLYLCLFRALQIGCGLNQKVQDKYEACESASRNTTNTTRKKKKIEKCI